MNNNTLLRQESIKKVFSAIRENGPLSKRQLQEITGFSWGNVSSITSLLASRGYLTSVGKQDNGLGRKPELFDISLQRHYIIGIDFNFRGITAVLCNLNGKTVWESQKTLERQSKNAALEMLCAVIEQALDFSPDRNVLAIAIAMQGTVDTKEGVSVHIDGIDGWENVPIADFLHTRYGLEVVVLHDPDCLLYTEKHIGAFGGSRAENAILIRMDHDIGIGVLYKGAILMSGKGTTCEIGTMIIPDRENGIGVLKRIVSTVSATRKFAEKTGKKCSFGQIVALAQAKDPQAQALFSEIGTALGFAINNASILLNPEKVILYGTLARCSELFWAELNATLKQTMGNAPAVLISELDSNAAAIGATLFAADRFIEQHRF